MKRHLLVTNDFPPKVGGIQNYLWDLWSRLDPASFVVLTATSDDDAASFDAAQAARGVRIERVPGSILFFPTPQAHRDIDDCVRAHGIDLVLLDPALPLGLLGPRLGVPYGVILHGAEVTVPGRLPGARAALGACPARRVDRRLGRSLPGRRGAPRRARSRGPVRRDPTRASTPAPSLRSRRPNAAPPGPGSDCPRPAPLVVSVSRLVPRKGMDVLIEAANRLAPSYPDLVVAIGGDGRERTTARAPGCGEPRSTCGCSGGSVTTTAPHSSVRADVFVMACRNRWGGLEQEGFGIVFLEAAAVGVPQVAGDSGGAPEAVLDGVTGLVVDDPSDPGAVAEAIRTLLADPPLRRRMGRAARTRVQESFDTDVLASRLAEALAGVAV